MSQGRGISSNEAWKVLHVTIPVFFAFPMWRDRVHWSGKVEFL